jgi:hypothetical protein
VNISYQKSAVFCEGWATPGDRRFRLGVSNPRQKIENIDIQNYQGHAGVGACARDGGVAACVVDRAESAPRGVKK